MAVDETAFPAWTNNDTLLLHDARPETTMLAVALARAMSRVKGGSAPIVFGRPGITTTTDRFWNTTVPRLLDLPAPARLILFCLTFDQSAPESCNQQLCQLEAWVNGQLEIWSHRWPDLYAETKYQVHVPPNDIADMFSEQLERPELLLLRMAPVSARLAPISALLQDEVQLCEALEERIEQDPESTCCDLLAEPGSFLEQLRRPRASNTVQDLTRLGNPCPPKYDSVFTFNLGAEAHRHEERSLERLLEVHASEDPKAIAIGRVWLEGRKRFYLFRRVGDHTLPSIQFLLEEHGFRHGLCTERRFWRGGQDSRFVDYGDEDTARRFGDENVFLTKLGTFAASIVGLREGRRRPPLGVTQLMMRAGVDALRRIDLCAQFTCANPRLSFIPRETSVLHDVSSRTNKPRSTLLLTLRALDKDAAEFLLMERGYNLRKLESVLEGVLFGAKRLDASRLLPVKPWPERLRIDVEFPEGTGTALERLGPSTRAISIDDAVGTGVLGEDSAIRKTLNRHGVDKVIVYANSETIGPSIPYGLCSAVVGATLARKLPDHGRLRVLDVFSGSGFSARALLKRQPDAVVDCVDQMIREEDVGLARFGVTWMRIEATLALAASEPVLDNVYDLVCMDPPHGMLLELMFGKSAGGKSLVSAAKDCADWLIVYQGHTSQKGRTRVSVERLRSLYGRCLVAHLGQEVIVAAGPTEWNGEKFGSLVDRAKLELEGELAGLPWQIHRWDIIEN